MGEVCAGHIKAFGFPPFPGNSVLKAGLLGRYIYAMMHSPHWILTVLTYQLEGPPVEVAVEVLVKVLVQK
ncbi:MAG: hypothetical protein MJE68_30000 [Proteobacteria bacterium]|nr:hypothetical protein [Pseudomonadota bacterium]